MSALGLLALTLGPGFVVLIWIYLKDKYEKEPLYLIFFAFLGGAASSMIVLGANMLWTSYGFGISNSDMWETAVYAFVSVGATEELVKLLVVLIFFYPNKAFNEPFDGIVYATAVSMGFATAENLIYVYINAKPDDAHWVALLRMFSAVPAHATFAIVMGYFIGNGKFSSNKWIYLFMAWFFSSILHGAYDFFLFLRNIPGISIGAFLSLYVGIRYARKAIRINQETSPFRPGAYE